MRPHEIEVGAVYMLDGRYRVPKRVVSVYLADSSIRGGKVRIQNTTALRTIEIWSAEFFAEHVIEKITLPQEKV